MNGHRSWNHRRRPTCHGLVAFVALLLTMALEARAGFVLQDGAWVEFGSLPGFTVVPDSNALFYQAIYAPLPGMETVVRGRAPLARHWGFSVLDQANNEIHNLIDSSIVLDSEGRYEFTIRANCTGAAIRCLELAGAPAPYGPGRLNYRIYSPDTLGDTTGGVGLPEVEYKFITGPGTRVPVDEGIASRELLDELTRPIRPGGEIYEALMPRPSGLETDLIPQGTIADPAPRRSVTCSLGCTANNSHVTFNYSMSLGNLVMTAKAPTYRAQHEPAANSLGVADGSEQLRYWSLCTTNASRTIRCLRDEEVEVGADGFFEVIIAPSCPVAGFENCLEGGIGGAGLGILDYRNIVARPDFANSEGPMVCPDQESQYCGDYDLEATYVPRD